MLFKFENEELKNLKDALNVVVAGSKDNELKMSLILGAQDLGEKVKCGVRVTTQAEEIQYQFVAKKPEGFVVAKENVVNINVNAAKFLAITDMTLSYNSEVFIDVQDNQIIIGVEGRCKTPLALEQNVTNPMKQGKYLFRVKLTGGNLQTLLNKGLSFGEDAATSALNGASIVLMKDKGLAVGYSTNGQVFARSIVQAEFITAQQEPDKAPLYEQMEKNLPEVCAANGKKADSYIFTVPKATVGHISSLTQGQKVVYFIVDDSHLYLQIGGSLMYTITLAASDVPVAVIDNAFTLEFNSQIGVDLATLSKGVDFINKAEALYGNAGKIPVKVSAVEGDEGKLVLSDDSSSDLESVVKPTKVVGASNFAVAGHFLRSALNQLTKGGVVICVAEKFIALYNGTIDALDRNSVIGISQVNPGEKIETVDETDEASAE